MATEHPRLRIADSHFEEVPRCSSVVIRLKDREYRIDFWPDRQWGLLLPEDRPQGPTRALSDDGWFTLAPI